VLDDDIDDDAVGGMDDGEEKCKVVGNDEPESFGVDDDRRDVRWSFVPSSP